MSGLIDSYRHCRRVTRRSGSTFRFAFRVLPADQRDAMHALYAFCRLSDDLGDNPALGDTARRSDRLAAWRNGLCEALAGSYAHPIHAALRDAVERFAIPPRYLHDVLDGVEGDLRADRIETAEDLQRYCYRVASAVGLACVRIWGLRPGVTWADAEPVAIEAGYAFQLTNILRDIGEDAVAGRCYLPDEELSRFRLSVETWRQPTERDKLRELLRSQVERARAWYVSSAKLAGMLQPPGTRMFGLMATAYSRLLERVDDAGPAVMSRRVRLGPWAKFGLLRKCLTG